MKLAFFDVDGTLSVPRYLIDGTYRIGAPKTEWIAFCKEHRENSYEYCLTIPEVRAYAKQLKEEGVKLYVLSAVSSFYEKAAKTKFVKDHYPDLFDGFFYVNGDEEKLQVLSEMAALQEVPLSECVLVEDNFSLLLEALGKGIEPVHISMLAAEKTEGEQ